MTADKFHKPSGETLAQGAGSANDPREGKGSDGQSTSDKASSGGHSASPGTPAPLAQPPDELRALMERLKHYSDSTIADISLKRYAQEFGQFKAWAVKMGLPYMPSEPTVVALYLTALADGNVEVSWSNPHHRVAKVHTHRKPYKYASIAHQYTAILYAHRANGHEWPHAQPLIAKVMRGIRHRIGTRKRKMTPLTIDDLKRVIYAIRETRTVEDLTAVRDRALLSLCFFGAFRRGELRLLTVEDLTFTDRALIVLVRKSKMDRESKGEEVGILPQKDPRICPIVLLQDWLEKSQTRKGTIFRRVDHNDCVGVRPLTGDSIADLVKKRVEAVGLDPDNFGAHSLRAGFATTAAQKGQPLHNIMRQGRWKDQRVAMDYIRPATVLDGNATEGLGDEDADE